MLYPLLFVLHKLHFATSILSLLYNIIFLPSSACAYLTSKIPDLCTLLGKVARRLLSIGINILVYL